MRIGFRICYDVRFPESFRPLFCQDADACFVCFSDTAERDDPIRRGILRGHLLTRAVENVMTVVSVNSQSRCPAAPNAVFDADGRLLAERGGEGLLCFDLERTAMDFGRQGRTENRRYFLF